MRAGQADAPEEAGRATGGSRPGASTSASSRSIAARSHSRIWPRRAAQDQRRADPAEGREAVDREGAARQRQPPRHDRQDRHARGVRSAYARPGFGQAAGRCPDDRPRAGRSATSTTGAQRRRSPRARSRRRAWPRLRPAARRPLEGRYDGDVNVTDFASVDKPTSQDLLKWKSLFVGGIDFDARAAEDRARRNRPVGLLLAADRQRRTARFNLQDLARSPARRPRRRPARGDSDRRGDRPQRRSRGRHRRQDRRRRACRPRPAGEHPHRQDHAAGRQRQLQRLLHQAELLGEPDRRRR